ncbi:hypothetical protein HCDG_05508 [Histoplasma capsulatum H143]|uniref:Uncharacterized protein n=1 Tax=Ajellomyces capsulatus (strain H143) TaxID=544712 RepID=C6HH27_AJECH|nr:hypothetical protein HCDG_05508 [Histoplasma capsulatum H143]
MKLHCSGGLSPSRILSAISIVAQRDRDRPLCVTNPHHPRRTPCALPEAET